MKNKSLDEIDENFKNLFDAELSKLQAKLAFFEKREMAPKYEKEFKDEFKKLLDKREKEIKNFLIRNKNNLFESEQEKKKKVVKNKGPLDVKHLDLSLSKQDKFKIKSKIFFFRLKLKFKNLYCALTPTFLMFHFFRFRFNFVITFQDFFRKVNFKLRRIRLSFERLYKSLEESFTNVSLKVKKFILKILSLLKKKKKKTEGEGESAGEVDKEKPVLEEEKIEDKSESS